MVSVFQLLQQLLNMGGTDNGFSNPFQREAHEYLQVPGQTL